MKVKKAQKSSQKTQRQLQVGEQIKRVLAEIFLEDNMLEIKNGHITVLQADISPDAKNAKIFLAVFGQVDGKKIVKSLNQASAYLRGKLSQKIDLRYTPELMFMLDLSQNEVAKIENLLKEEAKKFS